MNLPRLIALIATLLVSCVAVSFAAPDRSVKFPDDWLPQTIVDSEGSAGWDVGPAPSDVADPYVVNGVARSQDARAAGAASCSWRLQTAPGGAGWAQLIAQALPDRRFDALAIWVKNPAGRRVLLSMTVTDAAGTVHTAPPVQLGDELNWYEVAFYLRDFRAVGGGRGIQFPITRLALVVQDLSPNLPYLFFIDELRAHTGPVPRLDVVQLLADREVRAGERVKVTFRLRALTRLIGDVPVTVTLGSSGAPVSIASVNVPAPAAGEAGQILDAAEVSLGVPAFARPGEYQLSFEAPHAEIILPGRDRLPTAIVQVTRPEAAPTEASVSGDGRTVALTVRGRAVDVMFGLSDPGDPNQLAALGSFSPDAVRFGICLGQAGGGAPLAVWTPDGLVSTTAIDEAIARILAHAPTAFLLPRVEIATPDWWVNSRAGELCVTTPDGDALTRTPYPSYASGLWRGDVAEALRVLVDHMEAAPYGDHIIGYELAAGPEGRWLSWSHHTAAPFSDYGPAAAAAFQSWLSARYGSLENLRGAWGQPIRPATDRPGAVKALMDWSHADVPTPRLRGAAKTWLLDPVAYTPVVDYRLAASEAILGAIETFAQTIREATSGRKLCGAAYGHMVSLGAEGVNPGRAGHLALSKALRSSVLDFLVASPDAPAPASLSMPAASALRMPRAILPALRSDAEQAWSGLPSAIQTSGAAYVTTGLAAPGLREWASEATAASVAQIALIVDEESAAYLSAGSPFTRALFGTQIDELLRCGAPVDTWLLQDFLSRPLPPYRVYVFLDAFSADPLMLRQAVESQAQGDAVVLWLGAPSAVRGSLSGRSTKMLTDITVSLFPDAGQWRSTVNAPNPLLLPGITGPISYGIEQSLAPFLQVIDNRVEVLGTNAKGRPTLMARRGDAFHTVYSLAPGVPHTILRELARSAGVHIYGEAGERMTINRSFVALGSGSAETRVISLPASADVYELPGMRLIARQARQFTAVPSATDARLFLTRY